MSTRPLFLNSTEPRITVLAAIAVLIIIGLIAALVLFLNDSMQREQRRGTVTLTLPHGCVAPTQPGEQIVLRAVVRPGQVAFSECSMRRVSQ